MNDLIDLFFDKFQMAMTKLNPNWQEEAMDPDVSTSVELQKNKIMAVKWVISSSKDSQKLDKVLKEVSKEEGFEFIDELLKRKIQKSKISQAQYDAGNYKKEHIRLHGLDIAIENKKNTYREGTDKDGKKWKCKIYFDYGYIKGTVGADGDQLDVFLGPDKNSEIVFIINQIDPKSNEFDEHKVMLGFTSVDSAKEGYLKNYETNWKGFGSIIPLTLEQFKEWLEKGSQKEELKDLRLTFLKSKLVEIRKSVLVPEPVLVHGKNGDYYATRLVRKDRDADTFRLRSERNKKLKPKSFSEKPSYKVKKGDEVVGNLITNIKNLLISNGLDSKAKEFVDLAYIAETTNDIYEIAKDFVKIEGEAVHRKTEEDELALFRSEIGSSMEKNDKTDEIIGKLRLVIKGGRRREEGEVWIQPSGRKVTKKSGAIIPVINFDTENKQELVDKFVEEVFSTSDNKHKILDLWKIQDEEAKRIKIATGFDLQGYTHALESYGLLHAIKEHGKVDSEEKRGQLKLSRSDLKLIPNILRSPDQIKYVGRDRKGSHLIRFEKRMGDEYFYIEELLLGQKRMIPKTMFKKRESVKHAAKNAPATQRPETVPSQGNINKSFMVNQVKNSMKKIGLKNKILDKLRGGLPREEGDSGGVNPHTTYNPKNPGISSGNVAVNNKILYLNSLVINPKTGHFYETLEEEMGQSYQKSERVKHAAKNAPATQRPETTLSLLNIKKSDSFNQEQTSVKSFGLKSLILEILKGGRHREEGEQWTQPSGRKVTKKGGKVVPVGQGKRLPNGLRTKEKSKTGEFKAVIRDGFDVSKLKYGFKFEKNGKQFEYVSGPNKREDGKLEAVFRAIEAGEHVSETISSALESGRKGKFYDATKKALDSAKKSEEKTTNEKGIDVPNKLPFGQIQRIKQYTDEKDFDKEQVTSLKQRILENGFDPAFPIMVDKKDGKYTVVAGHHRHMAVEQLIQEGKLPENFQIPVVLKEFASDNDRLAAQVAENQRRDVLPTDEALAYGKMKENGWDDKKIAEKLGKKPGEVQKRLALNNLEKDLFELVKRKDRSLPLGIAEVLGMFCVDDSGNPSKSMQLRAFKWYTENRSKYPGRGPSVVQSYIKELKSGDLANMDWDSVASDTQKEALRAVGSTEKAIANKKMLDGMIDTLMKSYQRILGDNINQLSPQTAKELAASLAVAGGSTGATPVIGKLEAVINDLNIIKNAISTKLKEIESDAQTPMMFGFAKSTLSKTTSLIELLKRERERISLRKIA